ncbi:ULP-PROTEASE domain-containing protein [Mycena indigotica]|uniref:ULP-PROTEASE domain-containing protein n=1 Tax=Mycena indigotica TaxID=2126181 RepID=A0A8H6VYG8_9AGAR|nr:ULP-PROTEASE domain-containing protein [Mycena indigotica]KAF7292794.1 ULP-PROTEASE domain-containing protein [Mycena indigotica]
MSSEAANLKYMEFDETSDQVFILSRYSRRRNSDLQRFATTDLREIFPVTPGASRDKVTIAVNLGKPFRGQYEEFMVWMKRLVDKKSVMRVGMAVESVWKTIQTRNAERIKGVDLAVIRNEEDESDDELGGWNDHLSVDKILKPPAQESGQLSSVVYLEPDARLSVSQTSCVIGAQSHNNSEAISKLRPHQIRQGSLSSAIKSHPIPIPKCYAHKICFGNLLISGFQTILVYPSGQTGAISITKGDLIRLQPNGLLNDTLIEFSLKLWMHRLEQDDAKLAKEIHIFSSFFYKKLEQRELQESYASVAKWTAKFDLFKKKYLIVPINENLHWYLAIIYHPECVLRPEPPYIKASPSSYSESRMRRPDSSLKATTISEKSTFEDINIGSHWQPLSLLDDLDVDEPMEVDFSTEHVGNQQSTYIFTLDSLGSKALAKKNIPETGLSQAVYKHALVPQQPNSCDCGLYLLHFVQTFFEDPDKYANIIRTRTSAYPEADRRADWKVKGIADMRETLRSKIKDLSIKWKRESVVNELKKQWDSAAVSYSSENDSDVMGTASVEPHGAAPHFHTTQ